MHPDCCSAYDFFVVKFPHSFRIVLLSIYKIAFIGLPGGPNLQDSLYEGPHLSDSCAGRPNQAGLPPWGFQIIRIASLKVPTQLECFVGGPEVARQLEWDCLHFLIPCASFPHTFRIPRRHSVPTWPSHVFPRRHMGVGGCCLFRKS